MVGKAPPLLPRSQYMWCKYIIADREEIPSILAFYKLFLSDIKVKIFINYWHFVIVFWM